MIQPKTLPLALLLVALGAACTRDPRPAPAATSTSASPAPTEARPHAASPRTVDLAQLSRTHTVLLITHPRAHVLRAFRGVVRSGALRAPEGSPPLAVVGVYHTAERESYKRSVALARKVPWLHLRPIRCPLDAKQLFATNGCTPRFRALVRHSAGIVFTGGADIPPRLYGRKTRLVTVIRTPRRQHWEISLLFHLLGGSRNPDFTPLLASRTDYTVLGICMGLQAMNVATGGTLHQDVLADIYDIHTFEDALSELKPDQLHRDPRHYMSPTPRTRPGVFHRVDFSGAPALWGKMGATPEVRVMSIHHQAADQLGQSLETIATSADGKVVEAVRHRKFPHVLGVQFHPEYYYLPADKSYVPRGAGGRDAKTVAFHRAFWVTIAGWLWDEG